MSGHYSNRELEAALFRKGFILVPGGNHKRFVLAPAGQRLKVQTLVSHATYTVDDSLASRIVKQLRMPGAQYLRRFVECSVSLDDYLDHLRDSGVL